MEQTLLLLPEEQQIVVLIERVTQLSHDLAENREERRRQIESLRDSVSSDLATLRADVRPIIDFYRQAQAAGKLGKGLLALLALCLGIVGGILRVWEWWQKP